MNESAFGFEQDMPDPPADDSNLQLAGSNAVTSGSGAVASGGAPVASRRKVFRRDGLGAGSQSP